MLSTYSLSDRYYIQLKLEYPCHTTARVKLVWMNRNIKEWNQRLGYVSNRITKNNFEAYTQYYPGVQHEREAMPKKSEVLLFMILPDPLRNIWCNKEPFLADIMEFTHNGGMRWWLVLYGVKKKLIYSYRLGYKDVNPHLTLYVFGGFVIEHGITRQLIMDSHSILGADNLWKLVNGRTFTPLSLSNIDEHNHNPVKLAIQGIKYGISKIRNICYGLRIQHLGLYMWCEKLCCLVQYQ